MKAAAAHLDGLRFHPPVELTHLRGHHVVADELEVSGEEQFVEGDGFLTVWAGAAGADPGAEAVAVGAALLSDVAGVAVRALVDAEPSPGFLPASCWRRSPGSGPLVRCPG